MKKIKYLLVLILISTLASGCFKRDSLEGIETLTTVYPLEFIVKNLYGEHALITSIYPDDTNTSNYKLNNKQITDFSKKAMFIYNGITNDKDIAIEFLKKNNKMLIIDSTFGMEIVNGVEELWLNPSHLLMMTQNIKNGFKEYITNSYLEKEIDNNYEKLKISLSEVDADIKLTATNSSKKVIVTNTNILKFLEKYGFTVISLDDTVAPVNEKVINDVKQLIANKEINNLFLLQNTHQSDVWKKIVEETKINILLLNKLDTISDSQRDNNEDYISIMKKNIELIRSELYK